MRFSEAWDSHQVDGFFFFFDLVFEVLKPYIESWPGMCGDGFICTSGQTTT